MVNGWQAAEVLRLIEDAYTHARRIPEPWSELALETCMKESEVTA